MKMFRRSNDDAPDPDRPARTAWVATAVVLAGAITQMNLHVIILAGDLQFWLYLSR